MIEVYAVGIFKNPADISKWVATDRTIATLRENYAVYDAHMKIQLALYHQNAELMRETSKEQRSL
jgi:hypothetical protein